MPYINAAQISGNLGKDAETMTTQGGRTITRFSIASTKKWTDKANKTHESTDWFRVAAWGNLTKFASSLKKGDPVLVQGELRTGEYTDEKKVTRQIVELIAQTILRIDCTKLGVAKQGDAAEPEAQQPYGRLAQAARTTSFSLAGSRSPPSRRTGIARVNAGWTAI